MHRDGGFLPEEALPPPPRRQHASAQLQQPSLQQQQQRREREQLLLQQQQQQQQQQSMTCPRCSAPDPWVAAFDSCSRCCPPREQQLISKKTAKELYLLTDGDLKGLGSLLRANPHGATLAPMRLFLESQVKAVAAERHGVSVAGSGGGAGGASTSGRSGHHNDDEEEEYDDFGEEDLDGGFLKPPQKPKDALEARLEAARLERLRLMWPSGP